MAQYMISMIFEDSHIDAEEAGIISRSFGQEFINFLYHLTLIV